MTAVLAMEEHCEAYFAWKRAGFKDVWCYHVDAHLDIGTDGLGQATLAQLAECQSLDEARAQGLTGNAYLPWGGLHCGNYLYPAIREGIVSGLTWVVPPSVVEGSLLPWTRAHLNGWFDLELGDYRSLRLVDGHVEGIVMGIPFQLGTFETLPRPDRPVLFDLDIDYFLTPTGEVWQEAQEFAEQCDLESLMTTVAYSVVGGYTPTRFRRLAQPFIQGSVEGYEAGPLDEAAALVRFHRYQEALPKLHSLLERHPIEATYLSGTCLHNLGQHQEALGVWLGLLDRSDISLDGRLYLGGLCVELAARLDRPEEALELAQRAQQGSPPDYRLCWAAALALEQLGQGLKATRMLRRGLALAAPYLNSLAMRSSLARLYKRQGKAGLAKLELQKLEAEDVTGHFRALTLLR
ncbi:MAG: hypothetical protein KC910_05175 [Candidatus Eremiobacteraeota bacterium]|nr:hypothetical protein [Candidatus Eremiobacteraeota bacterium]